MFCCSWTTYLQQLTCQSARQGSRVHKIQNTTDKIQVSDGLRRIVTFLIIVPYKHSYLLTYLVTYLLWQVVCTSRTSRWRTSAVDFATSVLYTTLCYATLFREMTRSSDRTSSEVISPQMPWQPYSLACAASVGRSPWTFPSRTISLPPTTFPRLLKQKFEEEKTNSCNPYTRIKCMRKLNLCLLHRSVQSWYFVGGLAFGLSNNNKWRWWV